MKRIAVVLVIAAVASGGCGWGSAKSGCEARVPRIVEMGQRYEMVLSRSGEVLTARIEDIDESAGWVRVRLSDDMSVTWVNMASVERIRAAK